MRIDIAHARTLAHELLRLSTDPVAPLPSKGDGNHDIHAALAKALATYADNAQLLTHTAHAMGSSALENLTTISSTDEHLAHHLEVLT